MMQPDPLDLPVLQAFRRCSPLVHCITNDVVQAFTANILLALGASPAMVVEPDEAEQFAAIADALLINVGTLTALQVQAIHRGIDSALAADTPWVLDPVAVGGLTFRTHLCQQIIQKKPAAIRGNASEIIALAGLSGGGRGVDSTDSAASALPAAQTLARQTGGIVVVTGEVDYVTDGSRTRTVSGGSIMMTRVVGTGCALSAVVAACCALPGDRLDNITAGCGFMKQAGSLAAGQSQGLGSFAVCFLDALSGMGEEA